MSADPNFAAAPRLGVANFAAANTARDGTGTIQPVLIAGSAGSKINRLEVKAEDDLADCIVILWLRDGSSGTWRLWKEVDVGDGANADNTTPGYEYTIGVAERDYNLPALWELGATITVAPTTGDVNVFAWAGDF